MLFFLFFVLLASSESPKPVEVRAAYKGKQAENVGAVDFAYLARFLNKDTKTYRLGVDMDHTVAAYGARQYLSRVNVDRYNTSGIKVLFQEDEVMYNPGIGSQIDGIAHFGFVGEDGVEKFGPQQIPFDDVFEQAQVDNKQKEVDLAMFKYLPHPFNITFMKKLSNRDLPAMVTRAIIPDMVTFMEKKDATLVTETYGHKHLKFGVAISSVDFQEWLTENKMEVVKGDIVIFYTGLAKIAELSPNTFKQTILDDKAAGPDLSTCKMLTDKGVVAIGADTWGMEVRPSPIEQKAELPDGTMSNVWPCHINNLLTAGVYNLEMMDVTAAVADGVKEGMFVLGVPRFGTVETIINPILIASSKPTPPQAGCKEVGNSVVALTIFAMLGSLLALL